LWLAGFTVQAAVDNNVKVNITVQILNVALGWSPAPDTTGIADATAAGDDLTWALSNTAYLGQVFTTASGADVKAMKLKNYGCATIKVTAAAAVTVPATGNGWAIGGAAGENVFKLTATANDGAKTLDGAGVQITAGASPITSSSTVDLDFELTLPTSINLTAKEDADEQHTIAVTLTGATP
jgi:hypothetical protein